MCAKFKAGYDIPLLLEKIEKSRLVAASGKIQYSTGFMEYVPVLVSAIEFHPSIPELEKPALVRGALSSFPAHSSMATGKLRKELVKQEMAYLDKPLEPYVLTTNLSVEYFKSMRSVHLPECLISFSGNLAPSFALARKAIRQIDTEFPKPSPSSSWTRVRVEARSPEEAAELALDRLDLIRAIWNLFLIHGGLRMSSGRASPLSDIVAGPVHTVHFPDGRLAVEGFWFEPSYVRPQSPKRLEERWPEIKKFENEARRVLRKIPYRSAIEDALRRYGRALDMVDWDAAMLKLWSVLELLTDTIRQPYEKTISRASFIYKDRTYNVQVLRHIRDYRNRTVHAEFSRKDRETILCQVKNYVGDLLLFYFRMGRQFMSLEESGQFLDFSPDDKKITRIRELMKKALEFREH
jgi:hypothetical protein